MEAEIDYEYLKKLIAEYGVIKDKVSFLDVTDSDFEISFIARKDDIRISILNGLHAVYERKKYKLNEKPSIRKGSKKYLKFYKKDNRLVRIDSYSNGRIDVIFIAHYEDDKVMLYPFSELGGFYPTYAYVTKYENGSVTEEYSVVDSQIVYEKDLYDESDKVGYMSVNYVPSGKYAVLSKEYGTIILQPEMDYRVDDYTWWRQNAAIRM